MTSDAKIESDIRDLEKRIADGTVPPCPRCGDRLVVGKRQEGASGAIGFQYRCGNRACTLPPGHAYVPWFSVLMRALQKRAFQLSLAIIGSITLTGTLGFATGVLNWHSRSDSQNELKRQLEQSISTAENNFEKNLLEEMSQQYNQIVTENRVDSLRGKENVFIM